MLSEKQKHTKVQKHESEDSDYNETMDTEKLDYDKTMNSKTSDRDTAEDLFDTASSISDPDSPDTQKAVLVAQANQDDMSTDYHSDKDETRHT